jgi:hypothetical protein
MNFIKLVLKEFFFIFIDFSKLFLKFKVKEIEVLFFHRDIPFSPGYGAGTYVPLIASKKKKFLILVLGLKISITKILINL